ncbi:MAG: hypothetical protein AAGH89_02625 [Verrucomicrobiota bacterium]
MSRFFACFGCLHHFGVPWAELPDAWGQLGHLCQDTRYGDDPPIGAVVRGEEWSAHDKVRDKLSVYLSGIL